MRQTIILAAILSIGILAKAQTISLGPTGGFGHSWISNTDGDTKFNAAWNAGLSLIYSSKSSFGLGIDVKYSAEGNKSKTTGPATATSIVNANYVRVPVKLIYFFGKTGNSVRPKIYAGPSFGLLAGGKIISNFEGTKTKSDTKDFIKNFDFGATAGAGLNFKVAPRTWLNTDIAYYQGLIDVTKQNAITEHNGSIGINVGLLVGLGK